MSYFKNKSNQWIIAFLVLLNVSTLAFMWWNRPQPPVGTGGAPPPARFLAAELGFNKEQSESLKIQMDIYFKGMDSIRLQLQENRRTLLDLISAEVVDSGAVEQVLADNASLHTLEDRLFIDHYRGIAKICSASQKQQLEEVFTRAMRPPLPGKRPGMKRSFSKE